MTDPDAATLDRPPADAAYRDAHRPIDERVEDLLGRMTVTEKIAQLTSVWLTMDPASGDVSPNQSFLGMDPTIDPWAFIADGIGQITRPLGSQPIEPVDGVRIINRIQHRLVDETRLGIPAICHEECLTGLMAQGATSFASPLNFASTWDPALIERVGDVIRRQMRSVGTHQGLAPVADVARDARWGRVEETLGEDPYLVGSFVSAYVRGLQGTDLRDGVLATLKHFVGYSSSEGGRNFAPAHIGPRELQDVFLLPFEMAIKDAGAWSVMNSYQEIDGEAPASSHHLLTRVLRDQWGFEGFTVADYGAIAFLYMFHKVAADSVDAACQALTAGLDVELPNPQDYPDGLQAGLEQGRIAESDIDRSVRRVLRAKFALGLFDDPYVDEGRIDLDREEDRVLAHEVAARSITLLTNDGVLPLDADTCGRVAVVGPNAHEVMALFGNYSFENHIVSTHFPDRADVVQAPTVLDEVRSRLGDGRVDHAAGCQVMSDDTSGIADAAALAAQADVALVVVGDKAGHFNTGTVGEGTDATDLSLPGAQAALVDAVIETGTPTVVVLLNGRPFALTDVAVRAAAVVEAWFPGQTGARAITEVLFGDRNPGGKTTLTFSRTVGVQPNVYNHKYLGPGFPPVVDTEPVFPFGHGLSYTEFAYDDLGFEADEVPVDGTIVVSCTITNRGSRAGDEVVQLYVRDKVASLARPVKELKAFARVALEPGAATRVELAVPTDLLAFTDREMQRVVEPGEIDVMIGASSADIRLRGSVQLVGETRVAGEDRRRTSTVRTDPA